MNPEISDNILARFNEINSNFPENDQIKQFKANGGKVFGWLCTYVPEELLHAAGILPVRVTGCQSESELDDGNAYLSMVSCSFSRSCFQMGLEGKYSLLDGFIAGSTCDGARRLYDHWCRYIKTPFTHILSVPRKCNESTLDLYCHELEVLKDRLEDYSGTEISDRSLQKSIDLYNESRDLLTGLYELRKVDAPAISGAQTLEVLNAAARMPKEIFNQWLKELLAQLEKSENRHPAQARLMIIGSALNNSSFIGSIESSGALVVIDELCTGVRYFSDRVLSGGDEPPLKAIARRYLSNFPCARMFPSQERFDRILKLIKEYRVEGIVSQNVRYCVPNAHDLPLLRDRVRELGVPVLALDIEYGTSGSGQVQTRVQAFLEMIESSRRK
jgi:bzd-type benzoyl-CoA reductase N subunit